MPPITAGSTITGGDSPSITAGSRTGGDSPSHHQRHKSNASRTVGDTPYEPAVMWGAGVVTYHVMITAEITIASSLPLPTEIRVCTLVLCDQVEVSLKNTLLLTRLTKNANLHLNESINLLTQGRSYVYSPWCTCTMVKKNSY